MPGETINIAVVEDVRGAEDTAKEVPEGEETVAEAEEQATETEETEKVEKVEEAEETEEDAQEAEDEELDFPDWAKQYGNLPENVKSEEDLIKAYLSVLPEMKRTQTEAEKYRQIETALQARGLGGVDDLLRDASQRPVAPPAPQKTGTEEPYFDTRAASNLVKKMIADGDLRDTDEAPANTASYKAVANLIDSAIGPQLQKNEEVYTQTWRVLTHLVKKVRDIEWGTLDSRMREGIDRKSVDGLLDSGVFQSYDQAIRFQMFNKPELLSQLAQKAKEEGKDAGMKRLRNRAIRRNKVRTPSGGKTFNYDRYILPNGEWNDSLMNRELSQKQKYEMLDTYEKEHFSKQ